MTQEVGCIGVGVGWDPFRIYVGDYGHPSLSLVPSCLICGGEIDTGMEGQQVDKKRSRNPVRHCACND